MTNHYDEAWLLEHQAKMAGLKSLPPLPDRIEFSLPFLLKLPRVTMGRHWSAGAAYRKKLAPLVEAAIRPWLGHAPMKKAKVTVTRVSTRWPPCDYDNNVTSTKPLIDLLLVRSKTHPHSFGLLEDDDPDRLMRIISAERCTRIREQHTEVIIERK